MWLAHRATFEKFVNLELDIIHLDHQLMEDEIELARQYVDRCDPTKILCVSKWRDDIEVDSHEDYVNLKSPVSTSRKYEYYRKYYQTMY